MRFQVSYLPGDSDNGMFGGNSNWRGPIWMPVNMIIIRSLFNYYQYYGNDFLIECPTGSGNLMNLYQVAEEISAGFPPFSCRINPVTGRYMGIFRNSRRIRTGKTIYFSMNIFMEIQGPELAQATRQAGQVP